MLSGKELQSSRTGRPVERPETTPDSARVVGPACVNVSHPDRPKRKAHEDTLKDLMDDARGG